MRLVPIQIFLLGLSALLFATPFPETNESRFPLGTIPFVTKWKTDNPGASDGRSIRIPTAPNEMYNYTVDWGDGTPPTEHTGDATHTYAIPGTYTVSITGLFPRIHNGSQPQKDPEKLVSIEQWGNNAWTSMNGAFASCVNLVGNFTDTPDLSNVTDMSSMFADCTRFNSNIGNWDVSTVTTMSGTFANASAFDQDLGNWTVENVTDFEDMFLGATLSTANYDALLMGWDLQNLQPNIIFNGGNSNYCAGLIARTNMMTGDGWTITDAGTAAPVVNDIPHQTHVNGVLLPAITGSNLTGRERYYTGPNGTGTAYEAGAIIQFADFPVYPITLYIYDGTGSCSSEEDFNLTLTTSCTPPTADNLPDATECNSYTLPPLNVGNNYYTNTNAGGLLLNAGDILTTSQTIYIYTGSIGCSDESSFNVSIVRPVADTLNDVIVCNSYTLPALSPENGYYTETNGGGNPLNAGDVITSSQTIYIYAGTLGCTDESMFTITVTGGPMADTLNDVTECSTFTLPPLNTGNNYFTESNANGIQLNVGDRITQSQTLFIHTENGTCWDETSFTITINVTPVADRLDDVQACDRYILPILSAGSNFYTESGGNGILLNTGDAISTSQTLYIYAGSTECFDENSFVVTIDTPTTVDHQENVTACESYTLPILAHGNYFTESEGRGTELFANETITDSRTIYIYFESGGCSSESNFAVTIDPDICEPTTEETCTIEFSKFITPNGDGINDRLQMTNNSCGFQGELRIFDRYGKLVFQTTDIHKGWDGTYAGKPLPASDYWYLYLDAQSGKTVSQHFAIKR